MLFELTVDGLGVIDRAELTLGGGVTALTGETGAGKTLIVAAVGLLLGDRADRSLIRSGYDRALIEGRFLVPQGHAALVPLTEGGYADGGGEVVISREIFRDDRPAKVRINGRMATVGVVGSIGKTLVDIASQHEQQRLADPTARRRLLDAFAGERAVALADRVRSMVQDAAAASARLAELREGIGNRERELDILRYEVAEIARVDVSPGEIASLKQQATAAENAELLVAALGRAGSALASDSGAQDLVALAVESLRNAADAEPALLASIERLRAAQDEIADVASELARMSPTADEIAVDAIRARLDEISKLVRKYGNDPDADSEEGSILAYRARAESRIAELEAADVSIDEAEERARDSLVAAERAARELSDLRRRAAAELGDSVERMLHDLALGGARFATALESRQLYEGGLESVDFLVAANEGDELRPVARVASGGELSRIALALHVVTSTSDAATVVFDEVDAGVGGRAAQAVGRALADLARSTGAQVIVVTHLPQVAAFADAHFSVSKDRGAARVTALDEPARVEELSRMLAGLPESDRAREHAQELLVLASQATRS